MSTAGAAPAGGALASVAYVAGRGAGRIGPAASGATRVGPVLGGAAVAALWAAAFGWANVRKCQKGQISKKEAAQVTAVESIGVGLAAGAGIVAVGMVRASALVLGSAALVPLIVGTVATGATTAVWRRGVRKPNLYHELESRKI